MKSQFLRTLMLALLLSALAGGCDVGALRRWGVAEAKIPKGSVAEVRAPSTVAVWVREGGTLKRAYVVIQPGWLVGPDVP
jgi:hypothetical protein